LDNIGMLWKSLGFRMLTGWIVTPIPALIYGEMIKIAVYNFYRSRDYGL